MSLIQWLTGSKRENRLSPAWEFQVEGIIWRLLATGRGQFVGEERNVQGKSVSFFCLDEESGAPRWKGLRLTEPWWIGIEALHDDLVLLHEFAMPDFPDHKRIHALDLATGNLLWSNGEVKYLFSLGTHIYAANDQNDRALYLELDGMTGRQTRELDAESLTALRKSVRYEETFDFPIPFGQSGGEEADIAALASKLASGGERILFMEYLRKQGLLGIAYYSAAGDDPVEPLMDHHFLIAREGSGRILYRDILNSRAAAAVPDSFFGRGDRFYSISGKNVLRAFDTRPGPDPRG